MTTLNKNPRSLFFSVAIAIAVTTYFFSLGAHAGLFYNGYADLGISLDNVAVVGSGSGSGNGNNNGGGSGGGNNNGNGLGPGEDSYLVTLSGSLFDSDAFSNGSGYADVFTNVFPSDDLSVNTLGILGISDFQYSESYGDSNGQGSADSYALTNFSILFKNEHENPLRFDLSLFSFVSADIFSDASLLFGEDAGAYASITLLDQDGSEIFFTSAEAFVGGSMVSSEEIEESLSFELASGASYLITGMVDSDGYAVTVPEPSMFWLMALGLITMIVRNNHSKQKQYSKLV
jgi:hypothetical protein